jgi:hypothetical protein
MTEHAKIINQAIADCKEWLAAAGFKQGDASMQKTAFDLFEEEHAEYVGAQTINETLDAVIDMAWAWANMAYFGHSESDTLLQRVITAAEVLPLLDVRLYAQAVKESNWSKFCKHLSEAIEAASLYLDARHPDKLGQYINTSVDFAVGEAVGYYVIKRLSDNKILKSHRYTPAEQIYKTLKEQANESGN